MKTILKLGPADHGRKVSAEELMGAEYKHGYKYEIIDGKLYVSPLPNLPEDRVANWLFLQMSLYSRAHLDVINYVTCKARVFVPGREDLTVPEPDLTLYKGFPLQQPLSEVRWEDVSPILVVEVLSSDDPAKDLVRNVELYLQVPTIREYWIVDIREDANHPTMTVHRRQVRRWKLITVNFGETYTTRLLPGFELVLDPRE